MNIININSSINMQIAIMELVILVVGTHRWVGDQSGGKRYSMDHSHEGSLHLDSSILMACRLVSKASTPPLAVRNECLPTSKETTNRIWHLRSKQDSSFQIKVQLCKAWLWVQSKNSKTLSSATKKSLSLRTNSNTITTSVCTRTKTSIRIRL